MDADEDYAAVDTAAVDSVYDDETDYESTNPVREFLRTLGIVGISGGAAIALMSFIILIILLIVALPIILFIFLLRWLMQQHNKDMDQQMRYVAMREQMTQQQPQAQPQPQPQPADAAQPAEGQPAEGTSQTAESAAAGPEVAQFSQSAREQAAQSGSGAAQPQYGPMPGRGFNAANFNRYSDEWLWRRGIRNLAIGAGLGLLFICMGAKPLAGIGLLIGCYGAGQMIMARSSVNKKNNQQNWF